MAFHHIEISSRKKWAFQQKVCFSRPHFVIVVYQSAHKPGEAGAFEKGKKISMFILILILLVSLSASQIKRPKTRDHHISIPVGWSKQPMKLFAGGTLLPFLLLGCMPNLSFAMCTYARTSLNVCCKQRQIMYTIGLPPVVLFLQRFLLVLNRAILFIWWWSEGWWYLKNFVYIYSHIWIVYIFVHA